MPSRLKLPHPPNPHPHPMSNFSALKRGREENRCLSFLRVFRITCMSFLTPITPLVLFLPPSPLIPSRHYLFFTFIFFPLFLHLWSSSALSRSLPPSLLFLLFFPSPSAPSPSSPLSSLKSLFFFLSYT